MENKNSREQKCGGFGGLGLVLFLIFSSFKLQLIKTMQMHVIYTTEYSHFSTKKIKERKKR